MATGLIQTLRVDTGAALRPQSESRQASLPAAAPLFVESIRPEQLPEIHAEAKDLMARALEPNSFYEPAFLAHAMHHFKSRASVLLIWESPVRAHLLGLFPLSLPRFDVAAPVLRGWITPYMPNGTPLIDRALAETVLARFMDWAAVEAGRAAAVIFPGVSVHAPFAALARAHATRTERATAMFELRQRAVLSSGKTAGDFLADNISSRKAKELRRQRNRLAELGVLTIRTVHDRASVRDAFEYFLALEARSWKGQAGTAMMQLPAAAAFSRAMMRAMAGEGQCRIDLLELNGTPIAAAIQLRSQDRHYFWKTAYDEAYAKFSPGLLLAIELSVRNLQDASISLSDSCAEENHPMIDGIWNERVVVGDLLIATRPDAAGAATVAIRREKLKRALRSRVKAIYHKLRNV